MTSGGRIETINGINQYYEVHGSGEPVVLLHGFGGCSQDWAALAAEWSDEFQLIVPDVRGHGRSSNPSGEFRFDAAAQDLVALLDHLGVALCKAVGVSGGGNILLHAAIRQPERVKAMVIVSATSHFPDQARAIMRNYTFDLLPPEEQEKMRRRHPGGAAQIDMLFAQSRAFADSYDDLNFSAADLAKITARTLIVQGDRDPFYPLQISVDMYGAIPRASLWIIPKGGHAPIGGARWAEFAREAREFLRG